jgi:hypothetical protein
VAVYAVASFLFPKPIDANVIPTTQISLLGGEKNLQDVNGRTMKLQQSKRE